MLLSKIKFTSKATFWTFYEKWIQSPQPKASFHGADQASQDGCSNQVRGPVHRGQTARGAECQGRQRTECGGACEGNVNNMKVRETYTQCTVLPNRVSSVFMSQYRQIKLSTKHTHVFVRMATVVCGLSVETSNLKGTWLEIQFKGDLTWNTACDTILQVVNTEMVSNGGWEINES